VPPVGFKVVGVSVMLLPAQMVLGLGKTTVGAFMIVNVSEAEPTQPLLLVTVTVYVPALLVVKD
jgi:hypothetical protein